MGSSLCRPKWKFYMVSKRVMFMRARVGSQHAIFSFEVAKSAPHVNPAQEWPVQYIEGIEAECDRMFKSGYLVWTFGCSAARSSGRGRASKLKQLNCSSQSLGRRSSGISTLPSLVEAWTVEVRNCGRNHGTRKSELRSFKLVGDSEQPSTKKCRTRRNC
ncbi:hypothetical protein CRG98_046707 [Punica granatum]|uniref:Uncharacterized protein n=1 Tax=Punica granatum TaxID=22663 RepID=A0A2I0HMV4_PUNGR|nr:hypothetical protein CRG98_046707 [Punica granatum]